MTAVGIKIINGPNKWQLILALFEPNSSKKVSFNFEENEQIDLVYLPTRFAIQSVRRLDHEKEVRRLDPEKEEWEIECSGFNSTMLFKICYSSKSRKGEVLDTWGDEKEIHRAWFSSQLEEHLSFRGGEVIKLHYGIEDGRRYTHEEIGRIFKCGKERVPQILSEAEKKISSVTVLQEAFVALTKAQESSSS